VKPFILTSFLLISFAEPASAADEPRFPSNVTTKAMQMTGTGYVAQAPVPSPHFPASLTATPMTMTGSGYSAPAPIPSPHFPPSIQAPALQMTGTGNR